MSNSVSNFTSSPYKKRKVYFSNEISVKTITDGRSYNYNKFYRTKLKPNNKLYLIEDYMRENKLLLKDEYLEFAKQLGSELRLQLIDFIAHDLNFIKANQHLRIVR